MAKKLIDNKAIGVEVSWSFGDGDAEAVTLDRESIKSLFASYGFDVIEDVTPSDALVRAARMAPRVRDISIKEFKRPNKDTPRSFGIYSVSSEDGESGDKFVCGARVRIESGVVVNAEPEESSGIDKCREIAYEMAETANKLIISVINADISNALLQIGHRHLYWISRHRNHGGVYYINNNPDAEMFVSLLRDLETRTSAFSRSQQFIPQITEMYPRLLTMHTLEGATQDNFESEIDRLTKDLDLMRKEGKMRDSTIEKRADECDNIINQAYKYKMFLKEKLEIISTRLREIQSDFRKALEEGDKEVRAACSDGFDGCLSRPRQ